MAKKDIIGMKEDQNAPPQNMSLGIKIIFELKANEKQQTQEEFSALPLSA